MKPLITQRTSTFLKLWKKIPEDIKRKALKKEKLFRENPFHPALKTHRLKGELKNFYSFSIDYHWRIIFHFKSGEVVVFDAVGTHAVYR